MSWLMHVMNPQAPTDVDAISYTVAETMPVLYGSHSWESILDETITQPHQSLDFSGFAVDQVNGEHLAAVLTVSSKFRVNIPGWAHARQVAYDALIQAHQDPEDALYGIPIE